LAVDEEKVQTCAAQGKNVSSNSKDVCNSKNVSNGREAAVAIAGAPETILRTQGTEGCQQQYAIGRRTQPTKMMPPTGIPAKRGYQQQQGHQHQQSCLQKLGSQQQQGHQ
jgi:hypothetical protein